ncbi:tyrosinase [Ceratobasidium sp. AG-Ba]|nr:tyrosinase [Ceratobasidium sp. AG-Ba]
MRMNLLVSFAALGTALTGVDAAPPSPPSPPGPPSAQSVPLPPGYRATAKQLGYPESSLCKKLEVRKEWRTFTVKEKQAYIAAVNCLADKKRNPHSKNLKPQYPRSNIPPVNPDSSFYDDMTYIHMDQTDHIHYTGSFLPWHRWYTNMHSRALKTKCGYQGVMPYWDWSKDAASFNTSAMWDPNPTSGLGTFGDPAQDYQVTNGGFANMKVAYPISHTPRRQYTPFPYLSWWWVPRPQEAAAEGIKQSYVDSAINGYIGDFRGFQNATEKAQAFHANIHMIMGGDMAGTCPKAAGTTCQGGSTWTPNDPLFFFHHANMDRIWWSWQLRNPLQNFLAFFGGTNMTYSDPAFSNGYPHG